MANVIRVDVERPIERWRPFLQWLLCLPHLIVNGVLTGLSAPVTLIMGIAVLVRGEVPPRLAAFQVTVLRERVRTYATLFVLRRGVAPFDVSIAAVDPGDDPLITFTVEPPTTAERWALLRIFRVLPHVIVLLPIGVLMDGLYPVWMLVAAAGQGWPPSLERIIVRVERWVLAIVMYVTLVTNEPPRWGLAAYD